MLRCLYYLIFLRVIVHSILLKTNIFVDKNDTYHLLYSLESMIDNGLIIINAKYMYQYKNGSKYILFQNLPPNNRYSVAIYAINSKSIHLIGLNNIDIDSNENYPFLYENKMHYYMTIDFENDKFDTLSIPRISSYYSTLNVMTAQAFQNISHNMKVLGYKNTIPPNIETCIRSNNTIKIYDLRETWSWTIAESKINSSIKPVQQQHKYYHARPSKFGYYCLYYKRQNESAGPVPDCPNVTNILIEHAKMLESSGIDFIALDDTNLDNDSPNSDVLQIRPAEIIYKTWYSLRTNNGTNTPDVVAWNKANGVQWQHYLDLYATYPDMVLTVNDINDNNKTKKIFFVPTPDLNQTIVNEIEYDGGKNDVLVQQMWGGGGFSREKILNGTWTFFYPCFVNMNGTMIESLSMESLTECNFLMTRNSILGTEISASMSWQNNYGSLPFSSPSKLNGRTLKLIIQDVLSQKPDNVLFPSFNEHAAIAKDGSDLKSFGGNNTWGVGLYGDPKRTTEGFFVDTFGSERSRGIEPTDESGDYYYRLMQSCIRVIKLSYFDHENKLDIISRVIDNNRICSIDNEICCDELQSYVDVYSLYKISINDYIVSNNISEVNDYIYNKGYIEICAQIPPGDTTVFCENNKGINDTFYGHMGPFIVYKDLKNPEDGSYADVLIDRIGIYRCISNDGYHFIANSRNCNGINGAIMEYCIGYAAVSPSTAMPRRLVRCQSGKNDNYYHVVDDDCMIDDISSGVLGYVFG